jgi:autotransporter-associated beta strand protein
MSMQANSAGKGARILVIFALAAIYIGCANDSVLAQRALGLDISAWQGNISQTTWNNIRNVENRQFVFLRSSRGGTTGFYNQNNADNDPPTNTLSQRYDDPYFVQNINRATTAGMFAGSYHFARLDIVEETPYADGIANTGTDEADHFIQMAGAWMRPGYLLPVLDLESGIAERTPNEIAQFAIDFSDRIYEVHGVRPAVYIGGNYANDQESASQALQNELTAVLPTLWSARWPNQANPDAIPVQTAHPKDSYSPIYGPWDDYGVTHPWSFWQYASTGRLQSFNNGGSNLDFDVAQGGTEFLKDKMVPALWMNDSDGNWSTLANWNSGQAPVAPVTGPAQVAPVGTQTLPTPRLPGAAGSAVTAGLNDTVTLDRPNAAITVTIDSGTHNIRKLYARESLNISNGTLTINYVPAADSTPISAQLSAPVSLSGRGALSVHTLQVDATQTLTLAGGTLTINKVNLMPHAATPAKILLGGNVNIAPLAGMAAVIGNGVGVGLSGRFDLGGADRTIFVANGDSATDLTVSVPVVNGGLTKAGSGVLALTGANTYVGDTSVTGGTLRFASPTLADGADVYLAAGIVLDLAFAGADVIDSLFIGGASMAAGTWGAEGSGATFTTPLISGTGILNVTTFVAPPLWGDYNEDGTVDSGDYVVWRDSLGGETALPNDDTPGIGEDDYARWVLNFGNSNFGGGGAANSIAVPEPSAWCLLLTAAALWSVRSARNAMAMDDHR